MSTTLYIQTNKSVEVNRGTVHLKEIAYVFCSNKGIESQCRDLCVLNLSGKQPGSYVITALELVQAVTSKFDDVEVDHMGEPGIIINYAPYQEKPGIWDWIKTAFVCLILFFGAGFSIMTFNIEIQVKELFSKIHKEFIGVPSSGFSELELLYSLGIGVGVFFFFNHFSLKKKKKDPSALEVQMCMYENDVEMTILDQEAKGTDGSG